MNSLVALVLLGQVLGVTLSHHLPLQSDCNSKKAEQYAAIAEEHINNHSLHGYKQKLNSIENIIELPRRPHGIVIFLELEFLETTCHVLSPTPVENCSIRSLEEHAVEADCDVKLLRVGDFIKVLAVKCHSEPDSAEDVLKLCPICPILLPLNNHHLIQIAEYVLRNYNNQQPNHFFIVLEISRGQHKHEPESFYVEFVIVETNCSGQQAHDAHHVCHPKAANDARIGFCKVTVYRKHDATEKPVDEKFESDCVIFDHKAGESHVHLIEHHFGKNIPSPGHNHTILNLIHSHNDTNASHESHSAETLPEVAASVVKRDVSPTQIPDAHHTHPVKLCPGKIRYFKL